MSRIVVLGAGAWGTAIALSLCRRAGHEVTLWAHSEQEANTIDAARENTLFLPGFPLPSDLAVTADPAAISEAQIIVSVIPSEFLRSTLQRVKAQIHNGQFIVSATKGVEKGTHLRMTQVISSVLEPVGTLVSIGAFSGPSFALEVAQGQPTAVTVAFSDFQVAHFIQQEFSSETLRLYTSSDVIGVELGGALKNVIAIAAGIAVGVGLGHNSTAALITRGIAEMTRLAVACGGNPQTLAGLSGVGDLVLTCTGSLSRNRTVGQALGQGRKLPEILESLGGKVAEGVLTTRAALELARERNIEMPITEQMELILEQGKDPREAIRELMLRPGRGEH
ncbi:NAD(P)H-dependent glycerol-3-phosphate dehydrogenase [Occallatibacter savannae]|uniref:NAD(P)H-dependent glycerol-3-phosphate dehydrogenase n=1 Tax=Occallatibacter savannae TaxID=1002691 RepID=UPI000D6995A8|nr:NAD(P)H-dependent glycerol-3-phosphate dehydrogenase [Occallatibacter savannae]